MHEFVSVNRQITVASKINISAFSSLMLYGKGVFSTLAIYDSVPFLWEKHWRRLIDNARKLDIDVRRFDEKIVFESVIELLETNRVSHARCRLSVLEGGSGAVWPTDIKNQTMFVIQTADPREVRQNIPITTSPHLVNSTSPLAGIKSCNYLDNIIAREEAVKRGFDEAIRINEREEVVSACMANVFWSEGEKLFTPGLKTGCLAGTIREHILENREVYEVITDFKGLENADHIFLTSSGIGITQVGCFDNKEYARELHGLAGILDRVV